MTLTPKQLRRALKDLELTQEELARRLKVDPRTVRRWIAGDYPVPESVALLFKSWLRRSRR